MNNFSELNLHPELVQAVTERGYTAPTPIQSAVIPVMLAGQDVLGQAQTGTGKTAAFALPILQKLTPGQKGVQSLVLAPTRELALQVAQAFYDYGRHLGVRVLAVYGGQPYGRQISALKQGVDVVVGTPGRLLDLMRQGSLDLSQVQTVVLDEADEMLSMGFIEDIETILSATPAERQTALFSATLPTEIRRLSARYMRDPESVAIQQKQRTAVGVQERYYLVNEQDKLAALTRIFEMEEIRSALIFTRTRAGTGELAAELTARGFPAEMINGDLSQEAREQVLRRFRNGQITVLVATDVAARGLDIDNISHVINYDLPQDPEAYVHRVGRTGRAGREGIAISLLTPREQWLRQRIEGYTKRPMTQATLPTVEEIEAHRETQLLEKLEVWLRRDRSRRERELVEAMVEAGFDALDVAAAALKMARSEEKQRPIAQISEVQQARPKPAHRRDRADEGGRREDRRWSGQAKEKGMVRLTLNAGKAHGIRPNDVVSTIARNADIPGNVLGAIHIRPEQTFVDVPEQFVDKVLAKRDSYRIRQQRVSVERA
jgi:ATP-dependent RNA helicase DeaD